jgi:uncharacterized repeat protein (TIGR04076 family)
MEICDKLEETRKGAIHMSIDKKVKITVLSSQCDHYKPGDVIYMNGAFVEKEKSADICLTALSSIYNFIYAVRKGVTGEEMGFPDQTFQCPDIAEKVEFKIEALED